MFKKVLRKVVSAILVFAMLCEISTPLAYAAGEAVSEARRPGVSGEAVYSEELADIINKASKGEIAKASNDTVAYENADRREENTKSYRLTDGSNAVLLYPISVHEKDAEGKWVEIDNLLKETKNSTGEDVFSAKGVNTETILLAEPKSGRFLDLTTKSGHITWGIDTDDLRSAGTYADPIVKKGYEKLQIKSLSGILTYSEVLPGTDVKYQLLGHDIEEAIVINTPEAAGRIASEGIRYTLSLEGYRAELKDNQIYLYAEGDEPEYIITAAYMEDAALADSGDIRIALEENGDAYTVTIYPSSKWLTDPEREFPIVIDPTITQFTRKKVLDTCSVYSKQPGTNLYNYGNLLVGKEASSYYKLRAVIRFELPEAITESDMVIDASLSLLQRGYEPTGSPYHVYVNAHRTTADIIPNSATWNNVNGHFDTSYVIDQRITSPSTTGLTSTFDITALVKDWYQNGNNYGVTLMSQNETGGNRYVKYYSAHFPGVSQEQLPIVEITFINQDGLEDYLSYHNAGSDTMGTVSVGDFNGNLIYTYDDISLSGEYMPLSIQHVYNHTKRTEADLAGTAMHYGLGFRLNLSQRIESTSIDGYPYKLIDADGTSHYFTLKSGTSGAVGSVYEKEMETTTTLSKTSSGYTLDYHGDLVYYFNTSGQLKSITDTSNNKSMTLTYSSNRLTAVTDGAGRSASLTYNSSGYLTKITDPAGRETTYTYSSNRLTQITEPDGSSIKLSYTTGGDSSYMLTKIEDIDSSYLAIAYHDNSPCRVKSITEYGTSGGEGGKLTWTYGGGETVITDRKGLSQTMLFDNTGHTVCIRDDAGNAYFGSYSNTDDNNKHSLSLSSELQGTVVNYLTNHNFEKSSISPWAAYTSSGAGSTALNTTYKYMGSKSLCLNSTSSSGEYGISQEASVSAATGESVTFSIWVKVDSISASAADTSGLVLEVSYKNSSGTWVATRSNPVKAASDWQRLSHTVSVPDDAQSDIRVRVMFVSATGTVYIDAAQLETGVVSSRYNLIENGWFKDAAGTTVPSGWAGENNNTSYDMVAAGREGNGFSFKGGTESAKGLVQTVPVSGSAGDSYVYSAWAKANALGPVDKDYGNTRDFGVAIRFIKSDGTYETVSTNFEAKTTGWQYLSGTAVAPCSYTSVKIVLCYYYQKNYAVFDDIQLFREGFGDVLAYDEYGRVETSTDCMGRTTSYTYAFDGRSEVASVTYPDGSSSTYTYDQTTHKQLTETDTNGKTANYAYDSSWNNIKVSMTSGSLTLNSEIKEFGTAGFITKETNALGNETQYSYNTNKGLLTSVTEPNSAVTNYSYNTSNDLLTGLTKGNSSVSYSYANRRLSSLSHSGGGTVTYNLTYDQFGARTAVKVGTQNLAMYDYEANNGNLTRTTYGNGDYIEPVYDEYDRQIGIKYNGVLKYRWYYGADGRIGLEKDLENGITWRYLYDKSGNITYLAGSNGEIITNTYDTTGKLVGRSVTAGGVTSSCTFTYNTSNKFLESIAFTNGSLAYSYDAFERASKTLSTSSNYSIPIAYTFMAGTGSNTTTLIPETIRTTGNGWIADYKYAYDNMGNISTVWKKTTANGSYTQIAKYTYDSLNQLVREDNAEANKSFTYSYDTGGNILSVSEYAYTTGTLGAAVATRNYTYGDSNWKDKLTGWNGQTITYDAIGNPLSYRDGMSFTWENGRQLASVVNGSVTTSYTYDSSGTRNSKTVGGTTTWYTLAGSQVEKATTGSDYILYFYDADGSPISFRTVSGNTSADYYYVRNLQGDIVAICDASGNKKVEYTYDAWGKVLSMTGTLASTIGQSNPYRYRGYWFDSETGLYYLQSRYYDPQTGRFINADDLFSTDQGPIGNNMFTYCLNNPINGIDKNGNAFLSMLLGSALAGALAGALTSLIAYTANAKISGQKQTLKGIGNAILTGGLYGAIGGMLGVVTTSKIAKAAYSIGLGVIEGYRTAKETVGTKEEKRRAGIQNGIITALSTFAGAYGSAESTVTKILYSTTISSTKAGFIGAAGSVAISYISSKKQSKTKVTVKRGKKINTKKVKLAY